MQCADIPDSTYSSVQYIVLGTADYRDYSNEVDTLLELYSPLDCQPDEPESLPDMQSARPKPPPLLSIDSSSSMESSLTDSMTADDDLTTPALLLTPDSMRDQQQQFLTPDAIDLPQPIFPEPELYPCYVSTNPIPRSKGELSDISLIGCFSENTEVTPFIDDMSAYPELPAAPTDMYYSSTFEMPFIPN